MPDLSTWRTAITEIADSHIAYRGRPVQDVIEGDSLDAALWSVLFGTTPGPGAADALRRAFIAALDHGLAAPSTTTARLVASTRGPVPLSIAAGLIAFAGPAHGGAAEGSARLFRAIQADPAPTPEGRIDAGLDALLDQGERIPGYGHPYHSSDPRVGPLLAADPPDRTSRDLAAAVEQRLATRLGRRLPMNADAAVGAMLLDAGLEPADVATVTALGRAVGLAAHAREEQASEKPFRAPALSTVHWVGRRGEG